MVLGRHLLKKQSLNGLVEAISCLGVNLLLLGVREYSLEAYDLCMVRSRQPVYLSKRGCSQNGECNVDQIIKHRPCQAELRFRVQVKPVIDAGFCTQGSVIVGHGLHESGNE